MTLPSLNLTVLAQLPLGYRLLISLLAGAALPLAFAPYGYWWVALLSPALLYALLQERTPRQAFWIGEMYGIGLWCVGAFWLYTSIHTYGDTPATIALLMIGFVGIAMGMFHGVMAWAYRRFLPETPLSFAPIWVAFEWLKTWLFTGFPWLFVGYGLTGKSLDGVAPVAGVFAVSFVVIVLAAALVEVLRGRRFWLLPMLAVVALALSLDQVRWTTPKATPPLSVSLIQGNIPQDLKWLTEYRQRTLAIYEQLSGSEWGRDLVVWPEASIPMFQNDPDAKPFIDRVELLAAATDSAWVTGIPWQSTEPYDVQQHDYAPFYNSIMARGDQAEGLYHKQRLVPFGEYIPLEGALYWVLPNLKRNMDILSFSAGQANQAPLMVKGHRLAAAICYEVAYPNLTRNNARGSDFLVTLSNDAWFGTSDGPLQHLQMVQMRAKETGRWFIRATNTGVTAFIDDRGQIVSRSEQFKTTVLRGELPAMQGETPYMRWGDVPILGLSALLMLLGIYFKRKSQPTNVESLRHRY